MKKTLLRISPSLLVLAACSGSDLPDEDELPVNTAPMISGPTSVSLDENIRTVATYTVTDKEGNPFTLSLDGADRASFSISNAGTLSFSVPTDFEAPGDADGDNVYEVVIAANDTFTTPSTLAVSVTVLDVPGDAIPETSNLVTTDDTTFVQENVLSSFEFPLLIQQDDDTYEVTGVFADPDIAAGGWNVFEGPDSARIGDAAVSTCEITKTPGDCDAPQGTILIKDFEVTKDSITFLMSGGNGVNNVGVELLLAADDTVLGRYTPNSCGDPVIRGDQHYVHFETSGLIGEQAKLRIFDEESGGCGFVSFDHFYMTDKARGLRAASVTKPLPPVNVSSEDAAISGLIIGASFENPVDMIEKRGWTATGAFASPTQTSWQGTTRFPEAARLGDWAVSTCEMNDNASGCDAPVGTLTSPSFKVTQDFLNFLMAGGNGSVPVGMELITTFGDVIHSYSPNSCGPAFIDGDEDWTSVDISALRDAFIQLRLVDDEPGGCGFVSFDHFYQAPAAFNPAGTGQDGGVATLTPAVEAKLGFNVTLPEDGFDQVIGDFDDATTNNWTATDDFGPRLGADAWQGVSGSARVGLRAVSTCELNNNASGCDAPVGTLTSPAFMVDASRPYLNFLMAGGNGSVPVGLRVLDMSDAVIASYTPNSCGPAAIDGDDDWATIDLTAQAGSMVQIEVFDEESGGCGFVSFDHVHMSATQQQPD